MSTRTRITMPELIRDLAVRLQLPHSETKLLLEGLCQRLREYLEAGYQVELSDLLALSVAGGAELREDESGGFSAYAPKRKGISARAIGSLAEGLQRSCQSAIYYVSRGDGHFTELLGDHFGRRGWSIVQTRNGMEVQSRMANQPPVALIFESHAEGWRELVRELKCDPLTNWVPIVGIFPESAKEEAAHTLTVQPDEIIYEPFDFTEFIRTAGTELAARVTTAQHDVVDLEVQLPGGQKHRREAKEMVEEVLFRSALPESFNRDAGAALAEALDNALRHGHQHIECCLITLRMILDPKRLVLAVRDTGPGFDHAAALTGARDRRRPGSSAPDPLAAAADALRTRRGSARDGGISRMLRLVDRLDFNRQGNELVLTKLRPTADPDTSTGTGAR